MSTPLSKAVKRAVADLATSKGRRRAGEFIAEGTKCVLDTIDAFTPHKIFATADWLKQNPLTGVKAEIIETGRGDLGEMTSMSLAPDVIAVYALPRPHEFNPDDVEGRLTIALDRIQDPGNLGTIMRTADWMGIETILASIDTVDCFNPKTIQATMGAISRVKVVYGNLPEMLDKLHNTEIVGTFLDGENIYTAQLPKSAVIVMGNEGRGISDSVAQCVTRRILIPPYPAGRATSESLNVATATAITLSQFIARNYGQD